MRASELRLVDPCLQQQAIDAFEKGKGGTFARFAPSQNSLKLVHRNAGQLNEREIYESALLAAFTWTRTNNSAWPERMLASLFAHADREKLRAAGDPIPDAAVKVYRGVAGSGRRRRERGLSWTDSLDVACWFAQRGRYADPAVLMATVEPDEILACVNDRREREFIVQPGSFKRLPISHGEMSERARQHHEKSQAESKEALLRRMAELREGASA
jgi:hypothetical protein